MMVLTAKNKYLLMVVLTCLLVVLSYTYFFKPSWQKYHSLMDNYKEQQVRLEEIRKLTETLESFKAKEADYVKKISDQNVVFPNELNSAELTFFLNQKAAEVKVDLVKIEAQTPKGIKGSKVQINPYIIEVKGNPELIKKYIEKIQDLKRKIVITSFSIEKENYDAEGKPSIHYLGSINIQAFNLRERALVPYNPRIVIP